MKLNLSHRSRPGRPSRAFTIKVTCFPRAGPFRQGIKESSVIVTLRILPPLQTGKVDTFLPVLLHSNVEWPHHSMPRDVHSLRQSTSCREPAADRHPMALSIAETIGRMSRPGKRRRPGPDQASGPPVRTLPWRRMLSRLYCSWPVRIIQDTVLRRLLRSRLSGQPKPFPLHRHLPYGRSSARPR